MFGGGTDYPSYLNEGNRGIVVGGSINVYSYIACRYFPQFHPYKFNLVYSQTEHVNSVDEIQHRVIKAVLEYFKIKDGVEILHWCDVPSKTGTGSSSAFLVGLINAIACLAGSKIDVVELAHVAVHIEQDILQETVGLQDSLWATYGGLKTIHFNKNRRWIIQSLSLNETEKRALESHMLLFFTGIHRVSSDVAASYIPSLKEKIKQQNQLVDVAEQSIEVIESKNFINLGKLLHESWLVKRSLSTNISTPRIDELYTKALSLGALGGKLCGAGSGGSLLIFCHPEKRECIIKGMSEEKLLHIPFSFSNDGSKVILNEISGSC